MEGLRVGAIVCRGKDWPRSDVDGLGVGAITQVISHERVRVYWAETGLTAEHGVSELAATDERGLPPAASVRHGEAVVADALRIGATVIQRCYVLLDNTNHPWRIGVLSGPGRGSTAILNVNGGFEQQYPVRAAAGPVGPWARCGGVLGDLVEDARRLALDEDPNALVYVRRMKYRIPVTLQIASVGLRVRSTTTGEAGSVLCVYDDHRVSVRWDSGRPATTCWAGGQGEIALVTEVE